MGRISSNPTPLPPSEPALPQSIVAEQPKPLPTMPEPPVALHNLSDESPTPSKVEPPELTLIEIICPDSFRPCFTIEPDAIPSEITIVPCPVPSTITIRPPEPILPDIVIPTVKVSPPDLNLPPMVLGTPDLTPLKSDLHQIDRLGRKLKAGDVVDGDTLPPSEKPWNPDSGNKLVRWFDSRWKSDGDYELVNYCIFSTHMELELHRL